MSESEPHLQHHDAGEDRERDGHGQDQEHQRARQRIRMLLAEVRGYRPVYPANMRGSRFSAAVAGLLLLTVGVSACSAPVPTPTLAAPTSTPSLSPTPTATPEPVAGELFIDAQHIAVMSTSGEPMATFDYFQDPAAVIAALSGYFAASPTSQGVYDGLPGYEKYEAEPFTRYSWEGFALDDVDWETDGIYYENYRVEVTAHSINGVTITTVDGISVEDDADALAATYGLEALNFDDGGRYYLDIGEVPLPPLENAGPLSFEVVVLGYAGSTVTSFRAPVGGGQQLGF